ncbi:hypothetical protein Cch01nite_32670 [Cellulomonas chitinilytica]|uniref:YbaB/EbfC DNA-binding family protein n=1 Tax=Cellulomonas chitinilytica TaxID=398759 RepID=A0A919P5X2_9CELL|nr:YbaB/EbfC family nucleoid-associated protein [Cellulomonas chitinilytica]GIG22543.1 hypothetical protein Cch01nite_32670 [Cellulomonas chitinilytica]
MSDIGRLHAQVESTLEAAFAAAARAAQVAGEVAALTGQGTDPRGGVRIHVDHRGLLSDVQVAASATEAGTDGLRTAVLAAYRAAVADVQQQAAPLQAQLAGPRVDLTDTSLLDGFDAVLRGGGPR